MNRYGTQAFVEICINTNLAILICVNQCVDLSVPSKLDT